MPGKRSKVREDAVVRRARGEAAATRGLPRVVPEEYAARPEAAGVPLLHVPRDVRRRYRRLDPRRQNPTVTRLWHYFAPFSDFFKPLPAIATR